MRSFTIGGIYSDGRFEHKAPKQQCNLLGFNVSLQIKKKAEGVRMQYNALHSAKPTFEFILCKFYRLQIKASQR